MAVEFNHTIVHAQDRWAAARDVASVLGVAEPTAYGPFAVVTLGNGVTLDFMEGGQSPGDGSGQHYAFLVSETEFDKILTAEQAVDYGLIDAVLESRKGSLAQV